MKKIITILISAVILPLNILAYSSYIIPGGENIGITINSKGLIVVGFYKVNGKYIGSETLKVGDTILEIEGESVFSISDMTKQIEKNIKDGKVNAKIKRNDKVINTTLNLIRDGNIYKTGLYIKDKINGIGTLTYIDPGTKIYGALGHEITMNETNDKIEVRTGSIYESYVSSIDRSANGTVGSKNATINFNKSLGNIFENTEFGIFGYYKGNIEGGKIKVATLDEVKLGKAFIYTTLDGDVKEKYEIEITRISDNLKSTKTLSFNIKDDKLLALTGGIVQGMSGSPIIQNDKIIGAVTHVVVEDVKRGYGIYIGTMLEEGEN